ncbi:MAG: hypothetical protein HRT69_12855 [Flavobacteriaceae bacterium]|nr:hypothetical protein [Flavobacteriaceae bacterium]
MSRAIEIIYTNDREYLDEKNKSQHEKDVTIQEIDSSDAKFFIKEYKDTQVAKAFINRGGNTSTSFRAYMMDYHEDN